MIPFARVSYRQLMLVLFVAHTVVASVDCCVQETCQFCWKTLFGISLLIKYLNCTIVSDVSDDYQWHK